MPLRIEIPADASSPGLRRRRSLRRRPSAQTQKVLDDTHKQQADIKLCSSFVIVGPRIPMEMLERIIEFYVERVSDINLEPIPDLESLQADFTRYIIPCTLVSKDIRYLILRRFFRTMAFSSNGDTNGLLKFLGQIHSQYHAHGWNGGYSWVKSLHAPSFLFPSNVKSFKLLTNLNNMTVDFSHSGLLLQRSCVGQFFGILAEHTSVLINLTSLKLTRLPRIDVHLLGLLSKCLPRLTDVYLTSSESLDVDCCPNCYEDSLTRIIHSPVPDMYPDVIFLANAFGHALSSLKNLTSVFFGIFLSPSDMLDLHINHASNVADIKPTTVETTYDCARCAKHERITKQRELLASLIIARYLCCLKTIGWSSCFGIGCGSYCSTNQDEDNILLGGEQHDSDIDPFTNAHDHSPGQESEDNKQLNSRCICEVHEFTTKLIIQRISGRISIKRASKKDS